MAAINFPASPSTGDKHPTTGSIGGKVWSWDGSSWNIVSTNGSVTIIDDTARSFSFTVTYTNVAGNYNVVGTDRNGEVNGLNPTITVNEEDTLIFNVNAAGHPFYLVWAHGGSSDQVGGGQGVNTASNQGTVNGTVTWVTDVGDGLALPQGGLFYYQCGNHPSMYGTIKVLLKETSDGATHVHEFIDLNDTPNSYSGQTGKYIKVKTTEDGLEFTNAPSGGSLQNIVDSAQGVNVTGKVATTDGIDIDIGGNINAAGTSIDFGSATISFSGATISGLSSKVNGWVDTHLNQSGITNGHVLSWDTSANAGNGDYAWVSQSSSGVFQGTASGLVPASDVNTTNKYLRSDGTWQVVSSGGGADGNDYVTGAALGTGGNAKVLTLSFGDTSLNKTVDLSSINTDTDTTYNVVSTTADGLAPQLPASSTGKFFKDDGTWDTPPDTNTTYSNFNTSSSGLVPVSPGGTSKYLRADGTWQEVSGGGGGGSYSNTDVDAHLNQSNPTGGHVLSWNGSDYAWVAQTTNTNTTYDLVDTVDHGLAPVLPATHGGKFLKADGTWEVPPDTDTNTTYSTVSISAAGLAPQLPLSSSGKYLKDDGTWDTPPDTDTNTTYGQFSTSQAGLVPQSPGGTTKYLRADGSWQTVTSGGSDGNDYVTNLSLSGTTLKAEFATSSLDQTVDLASINTDTNTTYDPVSTTADGLAPQLPASPSGKFLRDDATWQTPPDTDTNTNYYANSFQYNTSTNVLSIGYAGNSSLDTTVTISPSGGGDIPSGTAMLFAQGSAPTGWTKSTSHNNKALRVVSGSGGGSGGSVGFTSAFQNHTVSISGSDTVTISDSDSVSISGSCTGTQTVYWNTTQAWLTVDQMPSHQHDYDVPRGTTGNSYGFQDTATGTSSGLQKVASTGGSNYHTHAIIMQYVNGSNFDFSGSDTVSISGSDTVSISGSDNVNCAVQYVDVIICTKG